VANKLSFSPFIESGELATDYSCSVCCLLSAHLALFT
jgi:hypothetical protein